MVSRSVQRSTHGFSLVELLVVLTIVAVLSSMALPLSELERRRRDELALHTALREIRSAIDAYKRASDEGRILRRAGQTGYPPTLSALVEGVVDVKSPTRDKIYFLRRLPRNPLARDLTGAPEQTWGLRSYASSPTDPQPGHDVYDVFVPTSTVSIRGEPYAKW